MPVLLRFLIAAAAVAPLPPGYKLLIITAQSLLPVVNPYVLFKTSHGLPTRAATVEEVARTSAGVDLPEKIRNFIREQKTDSGIEYVLLAGGPELVPVRYVFNPVMEYDSGGVQLTDRERSFGSFAETYCPTDHYYANLSEDWDPNQNRQWGESRVFSGLARDEGGAVSDVAVGRIPARNCQDLYAVLYKCIRGEPASLSRVLVLAGASCAEFPLDGLAYASQLVHSILAPFGRVDTLAGSDPVCTPRHIVDLLEAGGYSLFVSATAGGPAGLLLAPDTVRTVTGDAPENVVGERERTELMKYRFLADFEHGPILFTEYVSHLGNLLPFFGLVLGDGLGELDLDSYSFGEALLVQEHGAAGVLAMARPGFAPPVLSRLVAEQAGGGQYELALYVLEGLLAGETMGKAVSAAKEKYFSRHRDLFFNEDQRRALFGLTLFGDPSLRAFRPSE